MSEFLRDDGGDGSAAIAAHPRGPVAFESAIHVLPVAQRRTAGAVVRRRGHTWRDDRESLETRRSIEVARRDRRPGSVRVRVSVASVEDTPESIDRGGGLGAERGEDAGDAEFDWFDAELSEQDAGAGVRAEREDGSVTDANLERQVSRSEEAVDRAVVDHGTVPYRSDRRPDGREVDEHAVRRGRDRNRDAVDADVQIGVDGEWPRCGLALVTHARGS